MLNLDNGQIFKVNGRKLINAIEHLLHRCFRHGRNIFSNRFSSKFHLIKTFFYTVNDLTICVIKVQKLYVN